MKHALIATGAALLLAVLLSSPTFAQTREPPGPAPEPAAVSAEAPADAPIDALIETASTPEDRAALLRRCAGPPPHPRPAAAHQPPGQEGRAEGASPAAS